MDAPMTFTPRKLALAIGLAFAGWQSPTLAQSASAALFDEHVAAGLPQSFALPRSAEDERGEGTDHVVVEERLDTDVVFPDGSHATTYTGTANGVEATFTRVGDDVSVSIFDDPGAAGAVTLGAHHAIGTEPDAVKDVLPTPSASRAPGIAASGQPRDLQFWIFLHDQAGETNFLKFYNWYIAWWVRDMERSIKPGIPVTITIKDHVPGVTDFDYHKGTSGQALLEFRNAANRHLYDEGIYSSGLNKTMLFVGARPANWQGSYGSAIQKDTVAFASGEGPRHGVAHEFGHTLNAVHDFGETRFLCVTNMMPYTPGPTSCRIYTKRNDEQIREHVKEELARHADD
jgi:hypothetical protein